MRAAPPVGEGFRLAVGLLSAIPIRPGRVDRDTAGAAMLWAPAVGAALGLAAAAVLALAGAAANGGPLLAAALAITALAALTRGLHLDGLADLADGLGGGSDAETALRIMKRSDIGAFGMITLTLTLLIQVGALSRVTATAGWTAGAGALLVATTTARLALVWACRTGARSARFDGLGALVAGTVPPAAAAAVTVPVVALAAWLSWSYAIALGLALVAAELLAAHVRRRLGGITGDVLGAVEELTATVVLVVAALAVPA